MTDTALSDSSQCIRDTWRSCEITTATESLTATLERGEGRIVPWVFHRAGAAIRDMDDAWKRAVREAGVPGRLFHDLRRTAVRDLERARVPRSVAMQLTGHLTENVFRRYAIVDEADLAEGVAKLTATYSAHLRHKRASEELPASRSDTAQPAEAQRPRAIGVASVRGARGEI
jgi:integrase